MSNKNQKKNNLELRGSVWHVRWDIPKDVRHVFNNKRILKKALGSNKPQAQLQSLKLLHEWKSLTQQVRSGEYDPNSGIKAALLEVKTEYMLHQDDLALSVVKTA